MTSFSANFCKISISFSASCLFLFLQAKLGGSLSLQAPLGNYGFVGHSFQCLLRAYQKPYWPKISKCQNVHLYVDNMISLCIQAFSFFTWQKNLIHTIFPEPPTTTIMIIVSGGQPISSAGTTVELLHTNGSRICSLPDLPFSRTQHTQTLMIACGGTASAARRTCHTLLPNSGSWVQYFNLAQDRRGHTAWARPPVAVLLGGIDSGAGTTSEVLQTSGETTPGFNLGFGT